MATTLRPRAGLVAIAAALVFLAGAGSLVRYQMGYPLDPFELFGRDSSAEGRRELRALRRDAVLDVRAPGTHLRLSEEVPAGTDWWNARQPTEIRRIYTLAGPPGEAVDLYRARAEAGGWRLVETRCSFSDRSTSVLLTKDMGSRPASLKVYGYLERPPPGTNRRGLLVTITGEAPGRPVQGPDGASLRRRDVHCLRAFDPDSPDLVKPARQPGSATEMCGLLRLADVRKVVPAVTALEPTTNAGVGCRLTGPGVGASVYAATEARDFYVDRQSPLDPGVAGIVLFQEVPGPPEGAWADTRAGPVRLYAGISSAGPGLAPAQVVALAMLLVRR